MAGHPDVVIVGGGVIGSSIAYFLTQSADFDGQVVVLEQDPSYQIASTPRSLGGKASPSRHVSSQAIDGTLIT